MTYLTAGCAEHATEEGVFGSGEAALQIATNPSPVMPGEETQVALTVIDEAGAQLQHFEAASGKPMHLVALSSDLESFAHVQPSKDAQGTFDTSLVFDNRPYTLFVEVDPMGELPSMLARQTVEPVGALAVEPSFDSFAAFAGVGYAETSLTTAYLEHAQANAPIVAGAATELTVSLWNLDGDPVTDLAPWLGAPAHAFLVSEDHAHFQHLRGQSPVVSYSGDLANAHGVLSHEIELSFVPPAAGHYRMFVQYQRGLTVETTHFDLAVEPGLDSCAL